MHYVGLFWRTALRLHAKPHFQVPVHTMLCSTVSRSRYDPTPTLRGNSPEADIATRQPRQRTQPSRVLEVLAMAECGGGWGWLRARERDAVAFGAAMYAGWHLWAHCFDPSRPRAGRQLQDGPGDGGASEYEPPPWAASAGLLAPSHRLRLAHLPTPIHRWKLPRVDDEAVEVWIKRDDCTGAS